MKVIAPGSSSRSRPAQTIIRRITSEGDHSLLECQPLTGRTHQIRVHLAYAGFPISGDIVYGRRKQKLELKRQFLHAAQLSFLRPSDNKELILRAPLPDYLQMVLESLSIEATL